MSAPVSSEVYCTAAPTGKLRGKAVASQARSSAPCARLHDGNRRGYNSSLQGMSYRPPQQSMHAS